MFVELVKSHYLICLVLNPVLPNVYVPDNRYLPNFDDFAESLEYVPIDRGTIRAVSCIIYMEGTTFSHASYVDVMLLAHHVS